MAVVNVVLWGAFESAWTMELMLVTGSLNRISAFCRAALETWASMSL